MYKNREDVSEMFKYHPPATQDRIDKHNAVNEAALAFALTVFDVVDTAELKAHALNKIQFARMLVNQYITYESLQNVTTTEQTV